MTTKSKILFLIYIAAVAGLVYWTYPIIKNRYFAPPKEEKEIVPFPSSEKNQEALKEDEEAEKEDTGETISKEETGQEEENDTFLKITARDCDNKCVNFADDADELKYCQQVCGLTPIKKKMVNCDVLEDLEKDYCLKDLAVSKKDFNICDQIQDSGIKKTCKNRLTEEVLNNN